MTGRPERETETMADQPDRTPASPPPQQGRDASSLLPMLVGGLVLITIGMVAVALIV